MSKIKKITVKNFKAVSEAEMNFNGCTAIITGGNNRGKSTILRGIADRIRGMKPELIVKQGEQDGFGEIELTTGERFTWVFDASGKDKLQFVSTDGIKGSVTREIAKRYFSESFDIDKFLISAPKQQSLMLQKLVGLDFTEIDARLKIAFDARTEANREEYRLRQNIDKIEIKPTKVEPVKLDDLVAQKSAIKLKLEELYQSNKKHNDKLRETYNKTIEETRKAVNEFNDEQEKFSDNLITAKNCLNTIRELGYDGKEVFNWIQTLTKPQELMRFETEIKSIEQPNYITPEKPDESELNEIDKKILELTEINERAAEWTRYKEQIDEHESANQRAIELNEKVIAIEEEKFKMIQSAKIPNGIEIKEDCILIDGFPLLKEQLSTSKLYCAALRMASINLGEVKTLHFDASPLDKNTLAEIESWASENDLQLLIERPDFDNGEITYSLIESN